MTQNKFSCVLGNIKLKEESWQEIEMDGCGKIEKTREFSSSDHYKKEEIL
jgi:hypothetical protein